ncbi:MAG: NUDIX hydrolase [Pseudomonadota bacterium]
MRFCSNCGGQLIEKVPEGDNLSRHVCSACDSVFYKNPIVVAGCVPLWGGRILLCRRAIEPSYGCWTIPGGFVESGELVEEAVLREAREEANIEVRLGSLLSVSNVVAANQVHLFYAADMLNSRFSAGAESLEVKLFEPQDIPWDAIAFDSVEQTLRTALHSLNFADSPEPLQHSSVRPPRPSRYDQTARLTSATPDAA